MNWLLDCVYVIVATGLLFGLLWKMPQSRRYRSGLIQRLGFSPRLPPAEHRLWVHCASVGEAAVPRELVADLKRRHPRWEVVFSTCTDTGLDRLRQLYPGSVAFYMPLDFTLAVRAAMRRVQPTAVLLVEQEIWPNFLEGCRVRGVPVAIVNGRIGERSQRALRAMSLFLRHMWDPVQLCCARSESDAAGFQAAGLPADRTVNCGLLKCDQLATESDPAEQERLRALFAIAPDAPVLVAGSTHPGEEAMLAAAYRDLKLKHRRMRMILAPRRIERASEVVAALRARGLPVVRKTALDRGEADAVGDEIVVVDTHGDLVACYGLASCAFVGRSLIAPGGGQNMMEPAALGKPVLVGPHTRNFRPEMSLLSREGAALVVRDRAALAQQVDRLLGHPAEAERMGRVGQAVIRAGRGAAERTMQKLEELFANPA